MKTSVFLLMLASCATAAPIDDQIQNNAKFNEAAANVIHKAEGSLLAMKDVEKTEIAEMKAVGADMRNVEDSSNTGELETLHDTKEQATKAVKGEVTQQSDAVKALHTVSRVVKAFKATGVSELGENPLTQQKAVAVQVVKKLKQVEVALKAETRTSHTMEKIQKIVDETRTLQPHQTLGETPLDRAPEHHSLDKLAKSVSFKHKTAPTHKSGVGSLLSGDHKKQPLNKQTPAAPKQVDPMYSPEEQIIAQEKRIQVAEHNDEREVDRLAGLLH